MNLPGHISGYHVPGTYTPIGDVAQQHAQQLAAEDRRRFAKRRRKATRVLLLLG